MGSSKYRLIQWNCRGIKPRYEELLLLLSLLSHPSLYLDYKWSVCEDQHGSDHFPIIIESIKTFEEDHNPKWKLNKANWDLFHTLCDESLNTTSLSDSTDRIADFTSSLI